MKQTWPQFIAEFMQFLKLKQIYLFYKMCMMKKISGKELP